MFIVDKISVDELRELSKKMDAPIVKGVVDVASGIVAIDAAMHADEEEFLLGKGSEQSNLWGFNYWPKYFGTDDFIEYDSMINLRPWQGNRTRGIDDPELRELIFKIAMEKVYV